MSISSYGIIILKNYQETLSEKIEFSFKIQEIANRNRIGVNQGGNISEHSIKCLKEMVGKDVYGHKFELTDDPLDYNAEYIFGGYDYDKEIYEEDSFEIRIRKVNRFIKEVLEVKTVERLELFINVDSGCEFKIIDMNLKDFCNRMTKEFIQEDGWTPSLKIIIH